MSILYDSKIYVFAGQIDGPGMDYCDELYSFDLLTKTWKYHYVEFRPDFRRNNSAVVYQNSMYVYAGVGSWEIYKLNDFWEYNLKQDEWRMIQPNEDLMVGDTVLRARTRHSVGVWRDKMVIFAGNVNGENYLEVNTNEMWDYDFLDKVWTPWITTGSIPCRRHSQASVFHGDLMYVFGGRDVDGLRFNDLYVLNLIDKKWKLLAPDGDLPLPRAGVNLMSTKSHIYMFGGFDGQTLFDDAYEYSLILRKWKKLDENVNFIKAYYTTCNSGDNNWYHFGGVTTDSKKTDEILITTLPESTLFGNGISKGFRDVLLVTQGN